MAYEIVYCPSCGSATQLHDKMPFGYCRVCGDKISLDDAKNGRFSDELLHRADAEMLFNAARQGGAFNATLMKAAADKKLIKACVEYGKYLVGDGQNVAARPYVKQASDAGDPDGMFLYAAVQVNTGQATTASELEDLLKLVKKARDSRQCSYDCREVITSLEAAIEEAKAPKYTPSYSSYTPSYSSYTQPERERSGWYDWRNGEPLYRENGKIVNAKGEEVSAVWWD